MPMTRPAPTDTWTYVDGEWVAGNPGLLGPRSHAFWLAPRSSMVAVILKA